MLISPRNGTRGIMPILKSITIITVSFIMQLIYNLSMDSHENLNPCDDQVLDTIV